MKLQIKKINQQDIAKLMPMVKEFVIEHRNMEKVTTKVPLLTDLENRQKAFEENLKNEKGAIFVAEQKGVQIGYLFALTFIPPSGRSGKVDPGFISDLHVITKFRRRGVAIKLYHAAERWFREQGKSIVVLDANNNNEKAMNLYNKLDFTIKSGKLEKKIA